jgi:hypothetical protein
LEPRAIFNPNKLHQQSQAKPSSLSCDFQTVHRKVPYVGSICQSYEEEAEHDSYSNDPAAKEQMNNYWPPRGQFMTSSPINTAQNLLQIIFISQYLKGLKRIHWYWQKNCYQSL